MTTTREAIRETAQAAGLRLQSGDGSYGGYVRYGVRGQILRADFGGLRILNSGDSHKRDVILQWLSRTAPTTTTIEVTEISRLLDLSGVYGASVRDFDTDAIARDYLAAVNNAAQAIIPSVSVHANGTVTTALDDAERAREVDWREVTEAIDLAEIMLRHETTPEPPATPDESRPADVAIGRLVALLFDGLDLDNVELLRRVREVVAPFHASARALSCTSLDMSALSTSRMGEL